MTPAAASLTAAVAKKPIHVGCVSFLNAKPLIDGLESGSDPLVKFDVPSRLLQDLETGEVDIALCPVIDFQRSRVPLAIVPVGGIGCDGPTFTVRLYSRVPLKGLRAIHVDTDSHTSIALLRIVLAERYNLKPRLIDYDARERVADNRVVESPEAMLLIGDKVVTAAPSQEDYPHQLDLGEAWHELTGMPFVFAVWMSRQEANLGEVPAQLSRVRIANEARIERIVDRYAPPLGWPRDLAMRYLGEWLKFAVGPRELEAIALFFRKAKEYGVIDSLREGAPSR
ncbi:MAG: menaquinone biosynthesis protein [Phycisphaeraceae bacterium]